MSTYTAMKSFIKMRGRGIEPRPFAWQAKIIPLNQPREVNMIRGIFSFVYLANLDYYKRKVSYVKVYIRWYFKGVDLRVYQLCFTEMVFYSTMISIFYSSLQLKV